jgi:predicted HNH restriction endonuclease
MREYVKTNYTQMRERMAAKRQEIAEWKRVRGCSVCGETEPWVLDMHHLDPTEKETQPAQSATLKTFLKEADKCVLLCSNCHRKVHAGVLRLTKKHINTFIKTLRSK